MKKPPSHARTSPSMSGHNPLRTRWSLIRASLGLVLAACLALGGCSAPGVPGVAAPSGATVPPGTVQPGPGGVIPVNSKSLPPILFVHGNGDNASIWQTVIWRFESNGWPRERLHAINFALPSARNDDTLAQPGRSGSEDQLKELTAEIERVLATHRSDKTDSGRQLARRLSHPQLHSQWWQRPGAGRHPRWRSQSWRLEGQLQSEQRIQWQRPVSDPTQCASGAGQSGGYARRRLPDAALRQF